MKFELAEFHRDVSDEELLQDILRVKAIYGKETLTREEYKKYGKFGYNTFLRHFGGWNQTLELCGLQINELQRAASKGAHNYACVTDEQLRDDLIRVANMLCKTTFSSGEYRIHGEWSTSTYFKRFGTWNKALENAGLQPYKQVPGKKIATEALYNEIERIWVKLGRQPTSTDVKKGVSVYSLHAFSRRFGSWRKALVAFITYVNGDDDNNPTDKINGIMPSGSSARAKLNVRSKSNVTHELEHHKHKTHRDPNLRLRFKVLARDHFKCCSCGASPAKDSSVELHVDHIKPWSKGGETVLDNLQTLCLKCNLGKSDLM